MKFNYKNSLNFIKKDEIENMAAFVEKAHEILHDGSGAGSDFLGWLDYPEKYDKAEYARLQEAAARIRQDSDVLVVIGIGGSYLGAKAALDMLSHSFPHLIEHGKGKNPLILFAGHNLSAKYHRELLEVLDGRDFSVNVISKSGTTTEPAIAFRLLKAYMEERYGEDEAARRIYVTTDADKGVLRKVADDKGYESFVIPADIGGRFSVLTPVGLLPLAVAGLDIDRIMEGARDAMARYEKPSLWENDLNLYAAIRNILYRKHYYLEAMTVYQPGLQFFVEWWKQLFGESEGKDGRGIFPVGLNCTTDLHCLGQYVQDGRRMIFETVLDVEEASVSLDIPHDPLDSDGLNFLPQSGATVEDVNKNALRGTVLAHVDGGVPNLLISIPEISEYYFGQMVYFFEKACAISGYLLSVNPFDQPGVEDYKNNMYALIGKPGYEEQRKIIEERLK